MRLHRSGRKTSKDYSRPSKIEDQPPVLRMSRYEIGPGVGKSRSGSKGPKNQETEWPTILEKVMMILIKRSGTMPGWRYHEPIERKNFRDIV
jgi:hypothetical protein